MVPLPKQVGQVFVRVYIHGRTHALACNLHQSEFAKWQDIMACSVFLHVLHTYVRTVFAGFQLDSYR